MKDGYVSNKGNTVTIHIKDDYKEKVEFIKHIFGLNDNPDIKLEIVSFKDWNEK